MSDMQPAIPTCPIPDDLQKAINNLAASMNIDVPTALRQVIERGLSGIADDRGEG